MQVRQISPILPSCLSVRPSEIQHGRRYKPCTREEYASVLRRRFRRTQNGIVSPLEVAAVGVVPQSGFLPQVAVVTADGQVQLNKNVVTGSEPFLRLIGDLPSGTPVAFEAAFGWSWQAGLLEDYGFEAHLVHPLRCKAIASARLKNDKGRRSDPGVAVACGPATRGVDRPGRCQPVRSALNPGASGSCCVRPSCLWQSSR